MDVSESIRELEERAMQVPLLEDSSCCADSGRGAELEPLALICMRVAVLCMALHHSEADVSWSTVCARSGFCHLSGKP